jgi:hypothetical protein
LNRRPAPPPHTMRRRHRRRPPGNWTRSPRSSGRGRSSVRKTCGTSPGPDRPRSCRADGPRPRRGDVASSRTLPSPPAMPNSESAPHVTARRCSTRPTSSSRPAFERGGRFQSVLVSELNEAAIPCSTSSSRPGRHHHGGVEPQSGRALITARTGRGDNLYAFKIPRCGVAHTAPYFHDSSAKPLDVVVKHYQKFFTIITNPGVDGDPAVECDGAGSGRYRGLPQAARIDAASAQPLATSGDRCLHNRDLIEHALKATPTSMELDPGVRTGCVQLVTASCTRHEEDDDEPDERPG